MSTMNTLNDGNTVKVFVLDKESGKLELVDGAEWESLVLSKANVPSRQQAGPHSHAPADSQPAAPRGGGEQAVRGDRPDGAYEGGDHQVAPQPRQGGPPHPLAVRRIVTEWAAAPAETRQPRTEGPLVRQSPEACGGEPALDMNLELGTDLAGVVADHVRRYVADLLAGRRHPTELPFNGPDAVAPSRGEGRDAGRDTAQRRGAAGGSVPP